MPEMRIEPGQIALLWSLAAHAREADTEQILGFTIVNETLALVPYRQAAWWRARAPAVVAAVSGLPQVDPGAPYVQWLGTLCRALTRLEAESARPLTAVDVSPDIAADWNAWLPVHALWLPLRDRAGGAMGGVLFARDDAWQPTDLVLLNELGQVWSHGLAAFAPRQSLAAKARSLLGSSRRRRWAAAAALLACCAPVRLAVLAPAEVTAKGAFIVRSPLDGVIDKLYVQPNQRVAQGTRLFGLDSTTLQSHYALARKDYDTASEEYRQTQQLAVTDDKQRLDMALTKGKLDDSAVALNYSAEQLARVQVTAPRAGVAVFADPNDWTGKAVAVGEKVMLLADPANVELTAYLPVADDINVKPGGTLTLYPKNSPLATYEARIESVAYRAEPTTAGVLAYRVKASFSTGEARPPLGAMGTARFHGHWVPLAYYLLRRPLTVARQWLGW